MAPHAGTAREEPVVQEILDAILDPANEFTDFSALRLPDAYRAVTLHRDEGQRRKQH
jgi:hypothetical protein